MTDRRLRDLERRYTGTGTPEDGARLLSERLRVGRLPRARVELAAELGDPTAAALLGHDAPVGRRPHRWHRDVRAALARRLLWQLPVPRPTCFVHPASRETWPGARPLVARSGRAVRAQLAASPLWEVRASWGESETAVLLRAPRPAFPDLATMWLELALRHELSTGVVEPDDVTLGLTYLLRPGLARPRSGVAFWEEAVMGPRRSRLARLWPSGPVVRAFALRDRWDELELVAETPDELFVYFWETLA
jgi:hypothetical protein